MSDLQKHAYLEPTQEAGRAFFSRRIAGPVVMLNLLRFRAVADYAAFPDLAPPAPISGADAFQRYIYKRRAVNCCFSGKAAST